MLHVDSRLLPQTVASGPVGKCACDAFASTSWAVKLSPRTSPSPFADRSVPLCTRFRSRFSERKTSCLMYSLNRKIRLYCLCQAIEVLAILIVIACLLCVVKLLPCLRHSAPILVRSTVFLGAKQEPDLVRYITTPQDIRPKSCTSQLAASLLIDEAFETGEVAYVRLILDNDAPQLGHGVDLPEKAFCRNLVTSMCRIRLVGTGHRRELSVLSQKSLSVTAMVYRLSELDRPIES
ncbi:hypothetical protein KC345_g303 [Hortaea werneckii]|nr:hypothetical protein KC345_g303 [Hortaea werneckii]